MLKKKKVHKKKEHEHKRSRSAHKKASTKSKSHHSKKKSRHHSSKKRVTIAKGVSIARGKEEKERKKPGMSSLGKYKHVAKKDFAGPVGTFPIADIRHGRNALSRAHFASNPASIRKKVYAKYPQLNPKNKKSKSRKK